jgi:hypothetical protein
MRADEHSKSLKGGANLFVDSEDPNDDLVGDSGEKRWTHILFGVPISILKRNVHFDQIDPIPEIGKRQNLF